MDSLHEISPEQWPNGPHVQCPLARKNWGEPPVTSSRLTNPRQTSSSNASWTTDSDTPVNHQVPIPFAVSDALGCSSKCRRIRSATIRMGSRSDMTPPP